MMIFIIILFFYYTSIEAMKEVNLFSELMDDCKKNIFFQSDDDSQCNIGLLNKKWNELYKEIRLEQVNYISILLKHCKNNKTEFETFIKKAGICSNYVRVHICSVLGVDNTLKNNQCIYQDIESVTKGNSLFYILNNNSLLAAYLYIKQNKNKDKALVEACIHQKKNIVELLLKCGANINATDHVNYTALMWVVDMDRLEIVKLLIGTAGININATDILGNTALMLAVDRGHLEMVKLLIDAAGIKINATNLFNYTALMLAVNRGHLEIVKLLIDKAGININATNFLGKTAFMLAVDKGHLGIVSLFFVHTVKRLIINNVINFIIVIIFLTGLTQKFKIYHQA